MITTEQIVAHNAHTDAVVKALTKAVSDKALEMDNTPQPPLPKRTKEQKEVAKNI